MQGGEEEGTDLSATALYDYQAGKWAATLVSRKLLVYIVTGAKNDMFCLFAQCCGLHEVTPGQQPPKMTSQFANTSYFAIDDWRKDNLNLTKRLMHRVLFFFLHSWGRRNLIWSGWRHHQHWPDRRGLVDGRLQWPARPFSRQFCRAERVMSPLRGTPLALCAQC